MVCAALFLTAWSICFAQTASGGKAHQKTPIAVAPPSKPMGPPAPDPKLIPPPTMEKFVWGVQWRLIRAGTVTLEAHPSAISVRLESGGLLSSLYKVDDTFSAIYDSSQQDQSFCATSTRLESMEGKRHHEAQVTYDRSVNKAHYVERDLATNETLHETSVDLPPCASDAVGALARLRHVTVEPGKAIEIPVSDGRHAAIVKVEAQEKEEIKVAAGTFNTVRYEAFLLNGVVYPRKGRLWIWYTDDARHIPVQIRLRTGFPVGTVTLELEKQEGP
jgi:hypothetical protein